MFIIIVNQFVAGATPQLYSNIFCNRSCSCIRCNSFMLAFVCCDENLVLFILSVYLQLRFLRPICKWSVRKLSWSISFMSVFYLKQINFNICVWDMGVDKLTCWQAMLSVVVWTCSTQEWFVGVIYIFYELSHFVYFF